MMLSWETRFRRGLSQRSLAIEFDKWESEAYQTSRVRQRAENPSTEPSRKLGHITEYLKLNTSRFRNLATAREGIEHGMKLLVCELLLGGIGFSAILIFQHDSLRTVKYLELKNLQNAIEQEDSIMSLAEEKANWFGHCQNKYDGTEPSK